MKTSQDPRHQKRVAIVRDLFAQSFTNQEFTSDGTEKILNHLSILDESIHHSAPEWPLTKVAKVDLAILRLATYELLIEKQTPPKVVIDEAVELAKEFGSESSPAFVNGVLGAILRGKNTQQQENT